FIGAPLADLNPAAVGQQLLELTSGAAVVFDAGGNPGIGIGHRFSDDAGASGALDDLPKGSTGLQDVGKAGKQDAIAAIAQDDPVFAVIENKTLVDGFQRLLQLPAG